MAATLAIEGGFADLVLDGQRTFRAVMDALANPGALQPLAELPAPPAPLTPELGALALTLCDHDSPVWLDARLAAAPLVGDWLRFHTGAPLVADPAEAMFALVADPAGLPRLETFAQGTDEYPDRSTTLLVALSGLDGGPALTLTGPGIERSLAFAPPVQQPDFWVQWGDNNARYPRGVDLVLAAGGRIAGLPRTTRIGEA